MSLLHQTLKNSERLEFRELKQAGKETVLDYNSRAYRHNDVDSSIKAINLKEKTAGAYELNFLNKLFGHYLVFNDGRIEAKASSLNDYGVICSKIHPAFIGAYRLATKLKKNELGIQDIQRLIQKSVPLFLPQPEKSRKFADNHVHLGGVRESSSSVISLANEPIEILNVDKLKSLPRVYEFSYINNLNYTPLKLIKLFRETTRAINHYVCYLNQSDHESKIEKQKRMDAELAQFRQRLAETPNERFYSQENLFSSLSHYFKQLPTSGNEQILLSLATEAYQKKHDHQALTYYLTLLYYLFEQEKTPAWLSQTILLFIHLANIIRSYMVMSDVGLTAFVQYFNSGLRRPHERANLIDIDSIFATPKSKIEIKVSPGEVERFSTYIKSIWQRTSEKRSGSSSIESFQQNLDRYHFCLHFTRSESKNEQKYNPKELPAFEDSGLRPPRFSAKRKELSEESDILIRFLQNPANQRLSLQKLFANKLLSPRLLAELEGVYLNLTALPRGLDVAGDENQLPAEVFAPLIRSLRVQPLAFSGYKTQLPWQKHFSGFHLSMHAGEDFNHLLSGLRKIDETVRFCQFKSGDRLGHALALGFKPLDWLKGQGEIFINKLEYLDNLVWARHYAVKMATVYPKAQGIALQYENKICRYAREIYESEVKSPNSDYQTDSYDSPELLFRAWELRRNCPIKWQKYISSRTDFSNLEAWVPDYRKTKNSSTEYKIFKAYQTSGKVREKEKDIITIRFTESPQFEDGVEFITTEELDFWEALQDYLLHEYDRRGISIEANPSSNVYIGRINDYTEHPILCWTPPDRKLLEPGTEFNRFGIRTGPMKVSINTDDPGIFPTNLHNEYRLMKEAAKKRFGICQEDAEYWIEKIRQTGVDIFENSHRQVLYRDKTHKSDN